MSKANLCDLICKIYKICLPNIVVEIVQLDLCGNFIFIYTISSPCLDYKHVETY